jgi:hypothetical protein
MRTRKLRGGCGVLEPLSFTCHQLRAELIKRKPGRPDILKSALGRFSPEVTKINFLHPWTQNTFLFKTRMEINYIVDGDYILGAKGGMEFNDGRNRYMVRKGRCWKEQND